MFPEGATHNQQELYVFKVCSYVGWYIDEVEIFNVEARISHFVVMFVICDWTLGCRRVHFAWGCQFNLLQ